MITGGELNAWDKCPRGKYQDKCPGLMSGNRFKLTIFSTLALAKSSSTNALQRIGTDTMPKRLLILKKLIYFIHRHLADNVLFVQLLVLDALNLQFFHKIISNKFSD